MSETQETTSTSRGPIPPGYTPERVGFFTDAVFAIAMTLLVIEIPRPEGDEYKDASNLWHFLGDQKSSFTSYLLAFYILWVVWRQHHALFDRLERLDSAVVRWHFPLLLLIGFMPYGTTVAGHYYANPVAAVLFGLSAGGIFFFRTLVQQVAYRDHLLRADVDRTEMHTEVLASWGVVIFWVLCSVAAAITAWAQLAWFFTPLAGSVCNRWAARRVLRQA